MNAFRVVYITFSYTTNLIKVVFPKAQTVNYECCSQNYTFVSKFAVASLLCALDAVAKKFRGENRQLERSYIISKNMIHA